MLRPILHEIADYLNSNRFFEELKDVWAIALPFVALIGPIALFGLLSNSIGEENTIGMCGGAILVMPAVLIIAIAVGFLSTLNHR
jgi:hypothetical protein